MIWRSSFVLVNSTFGHFVLVCFPAPMDAGMLLRPTPRLSLVRFNQPPKRELDVI
jgi:hypothetical protein